jgi:hypothetical protein
MTTETSMDLSIEVSPATHRILRNALETGRTTFGDLPALEREDLASQARIGEIKAELEAIAALPYRTDLGDRYLELIETWLQIDRKRTPIPS